MKFDTDEESMYDDFNWVPKKLLNEYFTRDYYDIFIHGCVTKS